MRTIEQDFVQLEPRPVRQAIGDGYLPALLGQSDPSAQPTVVLSRGGWNNPTGVQRPGLQRVDYYCDKNTNTLRREYYPVMDAVQQSIPVKRDLLTKVKSVTFRFMDVSRTWQTQWPPGTNVAGATAQLSALRIRPIAVEVTLETEDWGKLVRIIEVAG
jgi:general secretion pathway protein J